VYAAGSQRGIGTYTYGTGVSAAGNFSGGDNVVLVKYDSNGTALWARTVTGGTYESHFSNVAFDSFGNVYVAGHQNGNGTYTFGEGVSASGSYSGGNNVVLVKYDSGGNAKWARTVSEGTSASEFKSVVVDFSGNVYAAGYQWGSATYTYGSGASATGTASGRNNAVLVKYDSSGNAKWARTVNSGNEVSEFYDVAADSSGNVYVAGNQRGTGTFTYGSGVSATGTSSYYNVVLVKYDSSGTALWARTVLTGAGDSEFYSVAIDSSDNVYAAGYQSGGVYTYWQGISATGPYSGGNVVLVKYWP